MLNTAKDSNPSELLSKPAKQEYNAKNTHWAWPALVIIILIENNPAPNNSHHKATPRRDNPLNCPKFVWKVPDW